MTISEPQSLSSGPSHCQNRRHLILAATTVVIVFGIAATIWALRSAYSTNSHGDCTIVEQLGPEWTAMQHSVKKLQNESLGQPKDLIAIADRESLMSNRIRAANSSVSDNNLKGLLADWADGIALSAKNQRDAATATTNTTWQPSAGADTDTVRAATLTFNATTVLRKSCPNLQLS